MKRRWVVKPPPPPQIQEHEVAYIEHGRMKAWVDRKICRLVLECWKRGWETEFSCENIFSDCAQIIFTRNLYLYEFLKATAGAWVGWEKPTPILENSKVFDGTWISWRQYTRREGPVWASDEDNAVLFSAAGIPQVLESVRKGY